MEDMAIVSAVSHLLDFRSRSDTVTPRRFRVIGSSGQIEC